MATLTKKDIKITRTETSKLSTVDFNNLAFGQVFSDHMLTCDYKDGKWPKFFIMVSLFLKE